MNSIKIRYGSRVNLQAKTEDPNALSATITLQDASDSLYDFTENFVNMVANFQDSDISLLPEGIYRYQIAENYADGLPNIYPDTEGCDGDCEFPTIEICPSLADSGSS